MGIHRCNPAEVEFSIFNKFPMNQTGNKIQLPVKTKIAVCLLMVAEILSVGWAFYGAGLEVLLKILFFVLSAILITLFFFRGLMMGKTMGWYGCVAITLLLSFIFIFLNIYMFFTVYQHEYSLGAFFRLGCWSDYVVSCLYYISAIFFR
jgi:hypothetical protein